MFITPPIGLMRAKAAPPDPAVFIAKFSDINASGDNQVTITKPTGTIEGDLMIFCYGGAGGSAANPSVRPSGWVNKYDYVDPNFDGPAAFFDIDVKIAGPSEPGNYTWTLQGGSGQAYSTILTYRPAHATQFDILAGADNAGGTPTGFAHGSPNVTTTTDNALLLTFWIVNRVGTNAVLFQGVPAGMTERHSATNGAGRSDFGIYVAEDNTPKSPAGLYTGKSILTTSTDVHSHAVQMAIRALGT
jgi:hypothetical protein